MVILRIIRVSTISKVWVLHKGCLEWAWALQSSSRCLILASSMARKELVLLNQLSQSSSRLLLIKATPTRSWDSFRMRSLWKLKRPKKSTWSALTSSLTWLRWLEKRHRPKWLAWLSTCLLLIWTTVFRPLRRCKRKWNLQCSCWLTQSTFKVMFWSVCQLRSCF